MESFTAPITGRTFGCENILKGKISSVSCIATTLERINNVNPQPSKQPSLPRVSLTVAQWLENRGSNPCIKGHGFDSRNNVQTDQSVGMVVLCLLCLIFKFLSENGGSRPASLL